MAKHTQTNCLSVFDHFVGLALKELRVYFWTLGSVIWVIRLIWTLKKTFVCTFQSLESWWPIGSMIITGFLQLLESLGSLFFLFIPCLDQFFIYFPKSSVNGISRKYKWQKPKNYVCNQTYKRLVWMVALIGYSVAWSVASPKFICLCINFSHYLD